MKKTKECNGGLTFTYYTQDYYIGGALEHTGENCGEELARLKMLVPPSGSVVMIGANIGTLAVPMAKYLSDGKLTLFEAQPATYELLVMNLAQNEIDPTIASPMAVGEDTKYVQIQKVDYDAETYNSGGASILEGTNSSDAVTLVEMVRLDNVMWDARGLDLLHVDVEGSELGVVRSAMKLIGRFRPIIYVENDRRDKSADLIRTIMEMGYTCYWHFPRIFNPDPTSDAEMVSINMLCLPIDKAYEHFNVVDVTRDCAKIMSEHDDWTLALKRLQEQRQVYVAERQEHLLGKKILNDVVDPVGVAASSIPRRWRETARNDWACIVRTGGVGDNLIASSVLPYLKEKYGHVEVIASDYQHVTFENNPHVDKLTVLKPGEPEWGNGMNWQDWWQQRAKEYAFFANLSHSCELALALTRAQTWYYWPADKRRKMCGQNYLEYVADIVGAPYETLRPGFFPDNFERERAAETKDAVGGRYVGWVMSGTRVDKIWPYTSVVVARIIRELGVPVIMFGAPGRDFEMAKHVEAQIVQYNGSSRGLHLACSVDPNHPSWPVRRILTQTMLSDVVVTPDTGPAWAVASEDVRKIVLLSHASPENITKHWVNTTTLHADSSVACWPCHLLIDEAKYCEAVSGKKGLPGSACITSIAPDKVFNLVKESLQ